MVVLTVYGISEIMSVKLEGLCDLLINTVTCSCPLNLKPENICCFFPKDMMPKGLGQEIIVFVDGLSCQQEKKNRLAKFICESINDYFKSLDYPDLRNISCIIRNFNSEIGNCSLNR